MSNTVFERLLWQAKSKGIKIGSAESLTSGLFSSTLAGIPGASAVLLGGIVSYSPSIKEKLLSVSSGTISSFGVVSFEVAKEMALGARKALCADLTVSCTGNAGPAAEPGKEPVGSVYIAVSYKNKVFSSHLSLEGDRNEIRYKTCLEMARLSIYAIDELDNR